MVMRDVTPPRAGGGAAGPRDGRDDWRDGAACRDCDPDLFFPEGTTGLALIQAVAAKQVCRGCAEQAPCLRFALVHSLGHGIWGGTTAEERRIMAGARPAWRHR
jgi:WhiB family redox-sensing transcriptional regulator